MSSAVAFVASALSPADTLFYAGSEGSLRNSWRGCRPKPTKPSSKLNSRKMPIFVHSDMNAKGGTEAVPMGTSRVALGDISVSPMGLGTWAWGNRLLWGYDPSMDEEFQRIFNYVVSAGINFFDSGDSYGTGKLVGRSEVLLGKFLRECPSVTDPSQIQIGTKFAAYPWRLTRGSMSNACKASLRRMQLAQMGLGQLHWSTKNYAPWQEGSLWDGLGDVYDQGLVRGVGVSNYGPKQLEKVFNFLANRGVPLGSVQVQFSLLSTSPEEGDLFQMCRDLDVRLIAYSPLCLGLLSGKYGEGSLPNGLRSGVFRNILPGVRPLLSLLREVGATRGKTSAQVALNWCLCKGTVPIPGAKTLTQAQENVGALGWALSGAEVDELDVVARTVPTKMVQNIFQTA